MLERTRKLDLLKQAEPQALRAEMAETMAMAVYMGGGPSLMYAAKMSAAFDEFTALAAAAAPASA